MQCLRQLGHDMLAAHEDGQGIEDAAVLAFATVAGRVVMAFNRRHFVCIGFCLPITYEDWAY